MARTRLAFLSGLAALAMAAAPAAGAQERITPADTGTRLFLFLYRPGPAWVAGRPIHQQDLRGHLDFMTRLHRAGTAFAGGPYVGEDGGMAVIRARDLAEAQRLLAADPAILNGVFAAEIRQWRPVLHGDDRLVPLGR